MLDYALDLGALSTSDLAEHIAECSGNDGIQGIDKALFDRIHSDVRELLPERGCKGAAEEQGQEVLITSGETQTIEFWPCTEEETPNAPR